MKVALKSGRELKYVDSKDLIVADNVTVLDLYESVLALQESVNHLTGILGSHTMVRNDAEYIIEIDGQLKRIQKLKLYDVPAGKIDLKLYKVENGKLVLDKNKIGGAL